MEVVMRCEKCGARYYSAAAEEIMARDGACKCGGKLEAISLMEPAEPVGSTRAPVRRRKPKG